MPDATYQQLKARFARLTAFAVPFTGVVYRSTTPKYATESDLLTGEGSKLHGGRWNPIGIEAIYASLTPETALAETLAHNRYYSIPVQDAMPRTFVALEVQLNAVLDLRGGQVRQRLRVSQARILGVDWRKESIAGQEPVTRQIGRAAHALGWEGLIIPSAADRAGVNLVVFPNRPRQGSFVKVQNADKLR